MVNMKLVTIRLGGHFIELLDLRIALRTIRHHIGGASNKSMHFMINVFDF